MSRSIDEKVVEMRFDNRQFETNVQTSLNTLGKLKESLKLKDAAKGLQEVDSASKNINFSPLGNGIETVKAKFSALEVMAVTALANITNSAVNAGKRLLSAFTIDPIKTGFQEYETQINAVQTILANTQSKGTTIDQVNQALDELNHYADMTIYNFTEMTRNIGTFTAAGIDLDTSVNAIQGIANLAATSGSTSQQASTAMYQLSQALAAGTVKLQDWNSVVNAGMGGQVFQDALKDTARAHGIAIDQMIKDEGSFRESLQNGWITSDILTETLQHFTTFTEDYNEQTLKAQGYTDEQIERIKQLGITGTEAATKVKTFTQLMDTLKEAAQSGWTQSWEYIIGDFEQAKELWTQASDYFSEAINKSAEARNKMLNGWQWMGGRDRLISGIKNAFEGLLNIIKPIKDAFREVFPPTTSRQLFLMTRSFDELMKKFKEFTSGQSEKIKSTFVGIFSAIDIVVTIIKEVIKGIASLAMNFGGAIASVLGFTSSIGEWISGLRNSVHETDVFGKAIDKVVGFLQKGIDKFKEFVNPLKEKIHMPSFDELVKGLGAVWTVFEKVGTVVKTVGTSMAQAFHNVLQNGDIGNLLGVFNGGIIASILLNIRKLISGDGLDGLKDMLEALRHPIQSLEDMLEPVEGILDGVKGCLQGYQEQLKAGALLRIAAAIGILAASIWVMSTIDAVKLTGCVTALGALFGELVGAMALLGKIDGLSGNTRRAATTMIGMSVAILIMATAIKSLADLNAVQLIQGVVAVGALAAILATTASLMSKHTKKFMKGAGGLILMSAAIKILASAVKDLATLNIQELGIGLLGVGSLLAAVAAFTNFAGSPKRMISTGIGIIAIAAAMKIFASAVKDFSAMNITQLGIGLLGLAGSLAAVTLAINFMPGNMIGKGLGMVAIAGAMLILANALSAFGAMSMEQIGKGLIALAGSLALLALALNLMNGAIPGSLALIIAAGALAVLAPALNALGNMEHPIKALLIMAAAFGVIGVAALLLTPVIPSLLGLGAAIALLGAGALACGVGVMTLATGLSMLAVSGGAGISMLCFTILELVKLIPNVAVAIGQGLIEIVKVIGSAAGTIAVVVVTLIDEILTVLAEHLPSIIEAGFKIMLALLEGLANHIGDIAITASDIIINFLNAIGEKLPEIVQAGWDLIINFIDGIALGVVENADRLREAIWNLGGALLTAFCEFFGIHSPSTVMAEKAVYLVLGLIEGISSMIGLVVDKIGELCSNLLNKIGSKYSEFKTKGSTIITNLKNGIVAKAEDAKAGMHNVITKVADKIKSKYADFKSKGSEIVGKLKSGITSAKEKAVSAINTVITGVISKIKSKWNDFKDAGEYLIKGFKQGIENIKDKVVGAAKSVADNVSSGVKKALGIQSPSRVFIEIGKYTDEGFIVGLNRYSSGIHKAAENIGQTTVDGVSGVLAKISELDGTGISPKITPVLDTSSLAHSSIRFDSNVSTMFTKPVDKLSQLIDNAQTQINKSNNSVIAAINELRNDLNAYLTEEKETALYVDSKKLASSIARPMNQQLNILAKRGAH